MAGRRDVLHVVGRELDRARYREASRIRMQAVDPRRRNPGGVGHLVCVVRRSAPAGRPQQRLAGDITYPRTKWDVERSPVSQPAQRLEVAETNHHQIVWL